MKVRFQVAQLVQALGVAATVPPRPLTADHGAGFLFIVRNKECWIYSRESKHQIRVKVEIEGTDQDGAFVFPADKVGALKYLDDWIEIEAGEDKDGDRHWVRYTTPSGAGQDELSTIDPRLMQGLDEALEKTSMGVEFPSALLREALSTTSPYLAQQEGKVADVFQTLQVFDNSKEEWKKGDGFMFAADGIRTCHFYCDKFVGKGLSLHAQNIQFLTPFLAKTQGAVRLRHGKGMTFIVDKDERHVLGWAHSVHEHTKFSYYTLKSDQFILAADKDLFVKALRYVRAALDSKRDKVRLQYTHADKMLMLLASEGVSKTTGMPIRVEAVEDEAGAGKNGNTEDFATNLNLNHLIALVEPMRAHRVELRVASIPASANRKEGAHLLRTVDSFILDCEDGKALISKGDTAEGKAAECQVTRFMPSRE